MEIIKEKDNKSKQRIFNLIKLLLIILYIYIHSKSLSIIKNKEEKEKDYKYFFCFTSMGKFENMYIKELIDYYKNIGVNKFYIGDNNNKDQEKLSDILKDYVLSGLVEVIDITGIRKDQTEFFGEIYQLHKTECKWMSFYDFDEYLEFRNQPNMTIQQYFSNPKFEKCNVVIVNWVIFNDNNLVKYDNRSMNERFTNGLFHVGTNRFFKSMIKGNLYWNPWVYDQTSHRPKHQLRTCDSNGDRAKTFNDVLKPPVLDNVYLKHFATKTVEEYVNKVKRGHPSQKLRLDVWVGNFFQFNEVTEEKVKYIEDNLNITLEKYHYVFKNKNKHL